MDINNLILTGRLVRDPEIKYTSSGKTVCNFSIASDGGYGGKKKANFFDCTAWNKTAEALVEYSEKGKRIAIEGRLEQESWEDSEGKKHNKVIITAEKIIVIDFKEQKEQKNNDKPDF